MLNELRELSLSLETANMDVEDLHTNFKPCPKGSLTYWVYIDGQGNIAALAPTPSVQVSTVRKWEKANGVSFPAFNVPPLLEAHSDDLKEKTKSVRKMVEQGNSIDIEGFSTLVNACNHLWNDGILKKITDCLTKPVADISERLGETSDKYRAIGELCDRARLIKAATFKQQLITSLIQSIHSAPAPDLIDTLFFYSGKAPKNFQVILELSDRERFEFPANHQEVQRWMNVQFMSTTTKDDRIDIDAFGCNASGKGEKYPRVRLPVLGNVILRAMNPESPCQTRYGMIDHHSFPSGAAARKGMKSALEWLGKEERKGKTWCDLSRRMERPMLLFAYPSQIPENLPDLAGMIGDMEDEDAETQQEKFSALAEKVTLALRGSTNETLDADVRVFVLAKMDKARTKVLASNRYSAKHVVSSARLWQEGSRNVPKIAVWRFGKDKGDKPVWSELLIPFPAEAIWCLNTVWTRQGTHADGAHGFSVNDSLCLLLGVGVELQQVADRALGAVLRNSTSLFLAIGQANAQGLVHKTNRKYAKQLKLLPSLLGLLLYKLGYKKGEIMTTPAFLIGKLFNLADSLHLEYCKGPRKGSIPPQLVGNALMATALETPEKALSMLSQRVLPYQAWALTLTGGDEVKLVKFFLKNLGEVTEQLKDIPLPQRSSDTDKAQMLLGYLARSESATN